MKKYEFGFVVVSQFLYGPEIQDNDFIWELK